MAGVMRMGFNPRRSCRCGQSADVQTLKNGGTDPNLNIKYNSMLESALKRECRQCVSAIVNVGVNINDETKTKVWMWAADKAYPFILEGLIETGIDVNMVDSQGETALMKVQKARRKYELHFWHDRVCSAITVLVEAGADVKNQTGVQCLMVAIQEEEHNCVQTLIEAGVDITAVDSDTGTTALVEAVGRYSLNCVTALLEAGADVNAVDKNGSTALMAACRSGSADYVTELIKAGADVNVVCEGDPLLIYIAKKSYRQNCNCISILVDSGLDVNIGDAEGTTALMHACTVPLYRCLNQVKELIRAGADVNRCNDDGFTALMFLCQHYDVHSEDRFWPYDIPKDVVETLLQAGAHVNTTSKKGETAVALLFSSLMSGTHEKKISALQMIKLLAKAGAEINETDANPALIAAVKQSNLECIKTLQQKGADVNIPDENGDTLLIMAVRDSRKQIIDFLLEANSDINAKNKKDETALIVAATNGEREIVDSLLKAGADANITNKKGETALHHAFPSPRHSYLRKVNIPEIAVLLVEAGADVNTTDTHGDTMLITAVRASWTGVLDRLLQAKADVNVRNRKGQSAMMMAAHCRRGKFLDKLLEAGASVNLADENGDTPLLTAVRHLDSGIVDKLLRAGANVNTPDESGNTPLIALVSCADKEERNPQLMNMLTKAGADLNAVNKKGKSPLMVYMSRLMTSGKQDEDKCLNVAKMLMKCGADVNLVDIDGNSAFNTTDSNGDSILMVSVRNFREKVLDFLLQFKVNLDATNLKGETALLIAISCTRNEVTRNEFIDKLLQAGASANVADENGHTPLLEAAKELDSNLVEKLLQAGANVNTANIHGETPLIALLSATRSYSYADKEEYVTKIVNALIGAGADVNMRDNNGNSALAKVRRDHAGCIKILINAGAHVNTTTEEGETLLLELSSARHCNYDLITFLLQRGARVTRNTKGETPLFFVVNQELRHHNKLKCVTQLIKSGAWVNLTTRDGRSLIAAAAKVRDGRVLYALIKSGASVNVATRDGYTPLINAAFEGNVLNVKLLLEAGANLNSVIRKGHYTGNTALNMAAYCSNASCIHLLLKAGAYVNQKSKWGNTALIYHIALHDAATKMFPEGDEVETSMVLLAAGELVKGPKLEIFGKLRNEVGSSIIVPAHLQKLEPEGIDLMSMCRQTIRRHLIGTNPPINLFVKVARLGLPAKLCSFLLYDVQLRNDDNGVLEEIKKQVDELL